MQMCLELAEAHSVEDTIFRHGAFAGHQHTPLNVVDLIGRVSVGIDTEVASELQTPGAPPPVKIETPWVGINFNGDAEFGAGLKNAFHVHFVAGASQELS